MALIYDREKGWICKYPVTARHVVEKYGKGWGAFPVCPGILFWLRRYGFFEIILKLSGAICRLLAGYPQNNLKKTHRFRCYQRHGTDGECSPVTQFVGFLNRSIEWFWVMS
jgi:hypothetical protein